MFLGLNGVVVKSHGGTDALGFAAAIAVAADLVRKGTNRKDHRGDGRNRPVPQAAAPTRRQLPDVTAEIGGAWASAAICRRG